MTKPPRAALRVGLLRARARTAVFSAGLLALVACGYSTGLNVAQRHTSVGLEVFGNDSYDRDLERPLYDAISRVLRDTSDAALVEPSRASVVMRGKISTFRRRSGIRSPDNKLLETGVFIEVEAGLYAPGATNPSKPPVKVGTWVSYIIDGAQNEREARERALRHIAEELVLDLFAPVN